MRLARLTFSKKFITLHQRTQIPSQNSLKLCCVLTYAVYYIPLLYYRANSTNNIKTKYYAAQSQFRPRSSLLISLFTCNFLKTNCSLKFSLFSFAWALSQCSCILYSRNIRSKTSAIASQIPQNYVGAVLLAVANKRNYFILVRFNFVWFVRFVSQKN